MTQREPLFPRSWRDTRAIRASVWCWALAVISGAALATGAYFVAPGGAEVAYAAAGVILGFFLPYALVVTWGMARAAVHPQQAEKTWPDVPRVVRRAR
jgi:hypothetical protein